MHTPLSLIESALERLVFIGKVHGLEKSRAFEMALVQIDLARGKLVIMRDQKDEIIHPPS